MNDERPVAPRAPDDRQSGNAIPFGGLVMEQDLARNWWAIALRGAAAIVFGIAAFLLPGAALLALTLLFAAYALVDGVFGVVAGVRKREGKDWLMILAGLAGIFIGIVTPFMPGMTALLLVLFIGWWALITGALELGAAITARSAGTNRGILALNGILSIAFGALIVAFPGAGAFALVLVIAAYAVMSGIILLFLGFRLRARDGRHVRRSTGARAAA
jgi:uncharacterized membrane protein HdeD (DUF308 family)